MHFSFLNKKCFSLDIVCISFNALVKIAKAVKYKKKISFKDNKSIPVFHL